MKYVYDGVPEHEARLTFDGLGVPLYTLDHIPETRPTVQSYGLRKTDENPYYAELVENLELTPRAVNVCRRNNIETVNDICLYTREEFGRLRNCGATTVSAVEQCLLSLGLHFLADATERKVPLPHQRPKK